ncbi:MAG: hypothetical protein ACPG4U_07970 [Pseudomonadales bacterium]
MHITKRLITTLTILTIAGCSTIKKDYSYQQDYLSQWVCLQDSQCRETGSVIKDYLPESLQQELYALIDDENFPTDPTQMSDAQYAALKRLYEKAIHYRRLALYMGDSKGATASGNSGTNTSSNQSSNPGGDDAD